MTLKNKNKNKKEKITMTNPIHRPVLCDEVLGWLKPKPGDRYLDLTAGYGGHARMVADRIGQMGSLTLVDRDITAVNHLKNQFNKTGNVAILHTDFLSASKALVQAGTKFDLILADIGVSSPHLDNPDRGFSFSNSGPLDMRMDQSSGTSAAELLETISVDKLALVLGKYGEVDKPQKLAKVILANNPYKDTSELAKLISDNSPYKKSRIHPATRVFQALRIMVNDEINQLRLSLPLWIELLAKKGKLAVISFHSLEDREVKRIFSEEGGDRYDARLQVLTKRPITASQEELVINPRARSAKLRVAQRK